MLNVLKQKASLIFIGFVILGGIGVYIGTHRSVVSPETTISLASSTDRVASQIATTTLRQLLLATSPQKCTFHDKSAISDTQGVVYVAHKDIRGDFNSMTSAGNISSHMITDGEQIYVWVDNMTIGFKAALPRDIRSSPVSEMDIDRPIQVACESWKVNEDFFTLPQHIEFRTLPAAQTR